MGFVEKTKNAAEDAIVQVKETVGDITGNDELKAEGKKDQGVSRGEEGRRVRCSSGGYVRITAKSWSESAGCRHRWR